MKFSCVLYIICNENCYYLLVFNYKNKNSLWLCSILNLIVVVEVVYKKCVWYKVCGEI